jgi:N-acetylneuraminic acid mutarotase
MPEGRLGAGAAGYPGRGFYVLGGATSPAMCDAPSSGVMRFDDATQSWQQAGQLTTPRAGAPAARVGRYIYLFGGCSDSGMLDTVERYDPATNTSKLLPVTMPGGARIRAAVTEHDDTIHLTGGVDAFGLEVLPNHIVFDPATGRFTVETPLPIDEYCFHGDGLSGHGMAEHENHIYVVGGTCDDSFDGVARVYGLDHD